MSLPPQLYARLREVLLQCGPLGDETQLSALFVDERLSPWQSSLPEASSPSARADAIIDFLHTRRLRQGDPPALILLLEVLLERTNTADDCHPRLADLEHELRQVLEPPHIQPRREPLEPDDTSTAPDWLLLLQLLRDRFNDEELRSLCFRLDVDYDALPGRGKDARVRELILYLKRRDNLTSLVAVGRELRPDLSWMAGKSP